MKLIVKVIDCPSDPSGQCIALCDDSGKPLPTVIRASVSMAAGEFSTIDVSLVIDGKHVRFEK